MAKIQTSEHVHNIEIPPGTDLNAAEPTDERAAYVKAAARSNRRKIGKNGGHRDKKAAAAATVRALEEIDGIDGDEVDALIDEVMNEPQERGLKIGPGLYEKAGRYQKIGEESSSDITNFTMTGLYLIKGDRPARIIHFKSKEGETDTIPITIESLTSDGLAKIVKGIGNLSAKWNKNQFEDILLHACRGQRKAETADYLGHQADGKAWAFANGVIHYASGEFCRVNEHGIAETPAGAYYIPQYKSEGEPMTYQAGEITFRQYFDLMSAAFGDNGATGAAVVLAYAFSDILFRETANIFLLFLAGKRETGKTSFADCIRAPFYSKKPATVNMKSNSTVKSRYRMLAKYSNGVVVFDEFTDIPKNTNIVVTSYNRDGYSRAATSNDNETLETPVRANSLFIGNYLPESEPAAMSRLIILPFRKEDHQRRSLESYRQLTGLLRKGTGALLREILTLRGKMEREYSAAFSAYMNTPSLADAVADIRDAEKVAAIMATLTVCGQSLGLTFGEMERIESYLMLQLRDQKALVDATDHTSQYFTEVALLIEDSTVREGEHYAFSDDRTEVVFRFSFCYKKSQEAAIKQRRELVGKEMLRRQLMEMPAFIKGPENARYRIRRGAILDLGFRVEGLPFDIRETLRGYDAPEDEAPAEGGGGEMPF